MFKDGDCDPSSQVQRSHSLSLACYHNPAGGTSQTLTSGDARLISDIDVRRALRAKSRRYRKGTYTRRSAARPPAPLPSPDTCLRSKRFSRSLSDILGLLENSSCNVRMRSRDEAAPSTSVSIIRSVPTSLPLRKRRRRYTASSDMTAASICRSDSQVLLLCMEKCHILVTFKIVRLQVDLMAARRLITRGSTSCTSTRVPIS